MPNKTRSNFTLTDGAKDLLRQMAEAQGLSMTAMLEVLIREAAKNARAGIPPPPGEQGRHDR